MRKVVGARSPRSPHRHGRNVAILAVVAADRGDLAAKMSSFQSWSDHPVRVVSWLRAMKSTSPGRRLALEYSWPAENVPPPALLSAPRGLLMRWLSAFACA